MTDVHPAETKVQQNIRLLNELNSAINRAMIKFKEFADVYRQNIINEVRVSDFGCYYTLAFDNRIIIVKYITATCMNKWNILEGGKVIQCGYIGSLDDIRLNMALGNI